MLFDEFEFYNQFNIELIVWSTRSIIQTSKDWDII